MPNIEIHDGEGYLGGGEHPLKPRIDQIMQELGIGDDAITTIICCKPQSCDGKKRPMPYVRVCCDREVEMSKIIRAFKERKLGVDVEKLMLNGFIPAEKME